MAKQTIKQRKAIRSAAAKKGWQTRTARERLEIEASDPLNQWWSRRAQEVMGGHREMIPNDIETATLRCHRVREQAEREFAASRPPSLWQRIKGWFA